MKFALVSLLALCISTVTFAQNPTDAGVASTSPPLGAVVPRGSEYTIRWAVTDQTATFIDAINLMKGVATALDLIIPNILANGSVPVSDLSYNWTIPAELAPGSDYALRFVGNNSGTSYTPYFSIQ
ncbi:hypothetical protein BDF21DRAFT_427024 [Thamnidium elegans]|nr:hypothetical protein BDF21DRAFT_427024 [Thamnidium elegans]